MLTMYCRDISSVLRAVVVLTLSVCIFSPALPAFAGQQTQASIVGQVRDESGGALPGVTVTATSPALQVPSIVVVTDAQGDYRLTPLPIGTYTVVFELPGFRTLRRDELRLTVGFVAREDVVLAVGGLQETITVSGASPVVDVSSTALSTQFTRENLELTPTGRNGLLSLVAQIPSIRSAVDVGGSRVGDTPGVRVHGQQGDTWAVVEGVAAQSPKTESQSAGYVDYSTLEEVRAEVIGGDVEAVRRGLKVNMVLKSGGNQFSGNAFTSYTSDRFQSDNITDALRAKGITKGDPVVSRYDGGADLGGRIIRDKLWFFVSKSMKKQVDQPEFSRLPDGSPAPSPNSMKYEAGKLSYQMSPSNRFIGFAAFYHKSVRSGITQYVPYESRGGLDHAGSTSKIEWQGIRGSSLMASAQFGYWQWYGFTGVPLTQGVTRVDQTTLYQSGPGIQSGRTSWEYRYHTKARVTWFKPGLIKGDHEFKAGLDNMDHTINSFNRNREDFGIRNYALIYNSGAPFQIQAFNYPSTPRNPVTVVALYAADSWTVSRKLTLNLGLRYSHENGRVEANCREASTFAAAECFEKVQFPIWQSAAPRFHAAYDIGGDGKTAIKAGWARYPQMRGSDEVALANKNDSFTQTYRWRDLNGNNDYDPGEIDLSRTGPDFVSISGRVSNLAINPDETHPANDEFMVAFERQLIPNLAVRVTGVYVRKFDVVKLENIARPYSAYDIPITSRDPGPDGDVGNADDPGTTLTYYDYPTALRAFTATRFVYDPRSDEKYKIMEFQVTKRLSNRWQLMASYSTTKKHIPFAFNQGGGNDYPLTTSDPNSEINQSDRTWEVGAGVAGAYIFPHDVTLSLNYQHRNGNRVPRTVLLRGGTSIPTLVVRAELAEDAHELPKLNMVDLRVEKIIRLVGTHKVAARFNIYNLTNASPVLAATDRSGPNFLRPTEILKPRIAEFSVLYSF